MELGLGSQQNGDLVNRTRAVEALFHLLDSSRRTIIRVEALVTVATALLFLQLVLGTWKRRWHNSFISGTLSLCNSSLPPLIFYTLSIMQSSTVKNSMYPIWGASLLVAALGTNAVRQFDYDQMEKKDVLGSFTGMARFMFYLVMLVMLMSPYSLKNPSYVKPLEHPENRHARSSSSCISSLVLAHLFTRVMELVVLTFIRLEIIKKKMANDHQNDTDAEAMEGDNYPVGCAIQCLPRPKVRLINIDKIWGCCGNSGRGERLEEVCLSLALCQSLIRRFMGWSSAKAFLPTAPDSVFSELLQTGEHYERAFRVIEVELGFCYDYFFTNYHSIYFGMVVYFPLFLCRVTLFSMVLVYTVQHSVTISTADPIVQVQITRADYIITLVLLGTDLLVELLQALVYLASDWIMVSLACQYVKHKQNAFLEKLIGFISRVAISPKRRRNRNRVAQHTVISREDYFSGLIFRFFPFGFTNSFNKPNLDTVEISPEIEEAIAGSIKAKLGEETKRLASQVRNSMFEHWALKDHWTLKDHSQVDIMLIWHIATDYCHLSPSSGNGSNPDRYVAVTLSRYCAYLLAFVPQLLPYHAADIRELIDMVKKERDDNFQSSGPSERCQEMEELGNDPPPTTVFRKGVKLSKEFEDMLDEAQRWKAMADFWAKTIIYIAPSHITAKEHMKKLENGGEFLTHIWAMLSHAGIMNLVRLSPTEDSSYSMVSVTYSERMRPQIFAVSNRGPTLSLE